MHVRGSSLSQPKVIEALRPFIVAFWGQKDNEPIPADLRPLYEASGFGHSNVRCFVLDSGGRLVHSFNGFPGNAGDPTRTSPEQYAAYFAGEIARGAAAVEGRPASRETRPLELPDVKDGVRLFIRLPYHPGSYGSPVVETVENRDEWKTLARPDSPRSLDAGKLLRWLRLCYPPGVNEQLEPFRVARGALTLTPDGKDGAVLTGSVRLAMAEEGYDLFEGTLEAALTYTGGAVSLRGVVDGTYWRFDPPRNRWMDWKLTAALESRPN
jgi:hypothetical protein